MNEREMLEFAAKAVGIKGEYSDGVIWHKNEFGDDVGFNPLEDDGNALRLAVKLNLHIGIDAESAGGISVEWDFDAGGESRFCIEEDAPIGGDDCAATRRAIVRAAAEIGKAMP